MAEISGKRLTIIGGGVMGLMTAYYAAPLAAAVTVLEKTRVGDPATASFSLTRSARNDYLDPEYARLAYEARRLWLDLQAQSGEPLLVDCGCLNLAKRTVTPDLASSYAFRSYAVLEQLQLRREAFSAAGLRRRYPQFAADAGRLDVEAGLVDVPAATRFLQAALRARGVRVAEGAAIRGITRAGRAWAVRTDAGDVESDVLVVTAGLGTNGVLDLLPGCSVRFPLRPDRPSQSKYFIPPAGQRDRFTERALPVFAYLDVGIYGHPLYEGRTPGVKIGFYNPPGVARAAQTRIASVEDFVDECMPSLRRAEVVDVAEASGADVCFYDLVADDDFILGPVPAVTGVFTGVGWRGTGYKFAPWAGRVLAQLALQQGTVYDIRRFAPGRFAGGRNDRDGIGGTAA
ncbi:MAG TPA: FAD-binding oxidoreductase [Streptosporangiaceae bacterium]|nr:FAD-binding oxidoreductase [Streptosporangiaceae bacterium]